MTEASVAEKVGSVESSVLEPAGSVKPHLSPSQLGYFIASWGCQFLYVWERIKGVRRELNGKVALGWALDDVMSENLYQKVDTEEDVPFDAALDHFVEVFDEKIGRANLDPDEDPEKLQREGVELLRVYWQREMPHLMPQSKDDIQRDWRVELPHLAFDLVGKIDYSGHYLEADQIVGRTLIDWKVKAKPYNSRALDANVQMTCYDMAFRHVFGHAPAWSGFHVLRRPSPTWHERTQDGNVPASARHPGFEAQQVERTEADHRWLMLAVESVAHTIEHDAYVPLPPGHWKCSEDRCWAWDICRGSVHRGEAETVQELLGL